MSKTAVKEGQLPMPQNGRWIWKDETNTLEYISLVPTFDIKGNKKERRKGPFQNDALSKRGDQRGPTPSISRANFAPGRGWQRNQPNDGGPKSPGPKKKERENSNVTFEDVKVVAMNMLSEVKGIAPAFEQLYWKEQFDIFLAYLMYYFGAFFEKRVHETKPNPMNIEPSLKEKKYHEDLSSRVELAQKLLGQAYGVLVLGIGLEPQHHMACGRSRVSNTYQDRSMYETFYDFCTFAVWITFKRKDHDVVKKELGRILRSDTFNPALRVKNVPDVEPSSSDSKLDGEQADEPPIEPEKKALTGAEYRRLQGKRPAIKSIINQRSPALVSLLPSPKEESHWLFKTKNVLSATTLGKMENKEIEEELIEPINLKSFKIGIIGEPIANYNPVTLTALADDKENDDDEEEDIVKKMEEESEEAERSKSKTSSSPSQTKSERLDENMANTRETTANSLAVTIEAPEDD